MLHYYIIAVFNYLIHFFSKSYIFFCIMFPD